LRVRIGTAGEGRAGRVRATKPTCRRQPLSRMGRERVRLTRPKPCLNDGAGSRGRPASVLPIMLVAPPSIAALTSGPEGLTELAGVRVPVG
jgi:hypothetical protein